MQELTCILSKVKFLSSVDKIELHLFFSVLKIQNDTDRSVELQPTYIGIGTVKSVPYKYSQAVSIKYKQNSGNRKALPPEKSMLLLMRFCKHLAHIFCDVGVVDNVLFAKLLRLCSACKEPYVSVCMLAV